MKAKRDARASQEAQHLAALMGHVGTIADGTTGAAKEIHRLKGLGLTLTEIEADTGISVHRLGTLTRQARTGENGARWEEDEDEVVDQSSDTLAENNTQDQAVTPVPNTEAELAGDDLPTGEPVSQ